MSARGRAGGRGSGAGEGLPDPPGAPPAPVRRPLAGRSAARPAHLGVDGTGAAGRGAPGGAGPLRSRLRVLLRGGAEDGADAGPGGGARDDGAAGEAPWARRGARAGWRRRGSSRPWCGASSTTPGAPAPGWETRAEATERFQGAVERLLTRHPVVVHPGHALPGTVAIASEGRRMLCAYLAHALGLDARAFAVWSALRMPDLAVLELAPDTAFLVVLRDHRLSAPDGWGGKGSAAGGTGPAPPLRSGRKRDGSRPPSPPGPGGGSGGSGAVPRSAPCAGGEVDLLGFLDVAEAWRADGSAGWCLVGIVQPAQVVAFLGPEAVREVFGDGKTVLAKRQQGTGHGRALRELPPRDAGPSPAAAALPVTSGSGGGGRGRRVLRAGRPAQRSALPLSRLSGLRGGHLARQRAAGHGEPPSPWRRSLWRPGGP